MEVISPSFLKAMCKLVQRVTETDMEDTWRQDCMTAFGWSEEDADFIINEVRRMAKRELTNAAD